MDRLLPERSSIAQFYTSQLMSRAINSQWRYASTRTCIKPLILSLTQGPKGMGDENVDRQSLGHIWTEPNKVLFSRGESCLLCLQVNAVVTLVDKTDKSQVQRGW